MFHLLHTSQYESTCCYCSYVPILFNCPKYCMYLSALQKFMQDLQFNSHPREFFHKEVMVTQKDMKLVQKFIHSCGLIHVQGPRMQQYFFLFYFF
jgi:putative heme iron utilization protein